MFKPVVVAIVVVCLLPALASAQSEEIEPRAVGGRGTTAVGIAGFADRVFSPEESLPLNYTAQVDVSRFLTRRWAVRLGALGSGSVGGDDADERSSGSGVPALHALGGVAYYFTPDAMVSAYVGTEYWAQLTQRAGRDLGSLIGTAGLQGAVSARASVFVQGGYGVRLNRGDDDELLTRIVAQVGFRLKF